MVIKVQPHFSRPTAHFPVNRTPLFSYTKRTSCTDQTQYKFCFSVYNTNVMGQIVIQVMSLAPVVGVWCCTYSFLVGDVELGLYEGLEFILLKASVDPPILHDLLKWMHRTVHIQL